MQIGMPLSVHVDVFSAVLRQRMVAGCTGTGTAADSGRAPEAEAAGQIKRITAPAQYCLYGDSGTMYLMSHS